MGNKIPVFTEDQLEEYQACTFLSRKEVLRAYRLFRSLTNVPPTMSRDDAAFIRAEYASLDQMSELRLSFVNDNDRLSGGAYIIGAYTTQNSVAENPFRRRMCEVFSVDGTASLSFNQFVEMFSVFSEEAPREIKAAYAFKLYDFDDDGHLSSADLTETVKHLTHDLLHADEVSSIVEKVLEETDIDCDGKLSESEFTLAILKGPDFVPNFHMRI